MFLSCVISKTFKSTTQNLGIENRPWEYKQNVWFSTYKSLRKKNSSENIFKKWVIRIPLCGQNDLWNVEN